MESVVGLFRGGENVTLFVMNSTTNFLHLIHSHHFHPTPLFFRPTFTCGILHVHTISKCVEILHSVCTNVGDKAMTLFERSKSFQTFRTYWIRMLAIWEYNNFGKNIWTRMRWKVRIFHISRWYYFESLNDCELCNSSSCWRYVSFRDLWITHLYIVKNHISFVNLNALI